MYRFSSQGEGGYCKVVCEDFFHNSINIGLPILKCEGTDKIKVNDEVEIDLAKGEITDVTTNKKFTFAPLPDFLVEWMTEGGMVEYLEKHK